MDTPENGLKRSVCVIGAGAAGLCALRHLATWPDRFNPIVCYEQSDTIGGTWNYTDQVGTGQNGLKVHTSMYRDMRVNGPVQIMDFPDFTFSSAQSYTHHTEVLKYLHLYVSNFNLLQYIQFEHHLQKVTREANNWKVTLLDLNTQQTFTRNFDVVVLCPGRYSQPFWPSIPFMAQFTGSIIHSHDYRNREPFTGQQVAVIGAGPSGIDITLEVATVATRVLFINTSPVQFANLPQNVQQFKGDIQFEFGANSIQIQNGESREFNQIDSVILATGYRLSLDYFDLDSCGLRHNDKDDTLDGVYRHLINMRHPTMALLSVCKPTLSFPLYHQQIQYFIKLLLNQIPSPSMEEMQAEVDRDMAARAALGLRAKDRHLLKSIPVMKDYFELLERDGQLEPMRPVVYKLLEEIIKTRNGNSIGYKEVNYRLLSEEQFEIVSGTVYKGG